MQIREMNVGDIDLVLPLYIEYYNTYEDSCWTEETAKKRIKQVLTIEDSYSLIMKDAGTACIELQAVNDEMHELFYGKAGFGNAHNFVLKVKWFE